MVVFILLLPVLKCLFWIVSCHAATDYNLTGYLLNVECLATTVNKPNW